MYLDKKYHNLIIVGVIVLVLTFGSNLLFPKMVKGQQQEEAICTNQLMHPSSGTVLPVILLHGYDEGPSVWSRWEKQFNDNSIPFCTVSFSASSKNFDECGSAFDHAKELRSIIKKVENKTGATQVNIVGHSKGGLDARMYLDKSGAADVAKLIMIGTPNSGDPIEDQLNLFDTCTPASDDLKTNANDTKAKENLHTNYYAIDGKWVPPSPFSIPFYIKFNPSLAWNPFDPLLLPTSTPSNCLQQDWLGFQIRGYTFLAVTGFANNDGIVPQQSVLSLPYSTHIGSTDDCHTNLLSEKSFILSEPYLLGIKR